MNSVRLNGKTLLRPWTNQTRHTKTSLIEKKAKKIYYSSKLLKCAGDIKKNECYEKYNWKLKNKIDKSSM